MWRISDFFVTNQGRPKFTMNDFDDVAEAPLFLDVLRLSQSASYVSSLKQAKALEAYKQGLGDLPRELSSYIKKLQESSHKGNTGSKAKYETTKNGPKFKERSEPSFSVTSDEQNHLKNALQKKYGEIKLYDSYRTMKESGGSAFGVRYHALAEVNGNIHLIEFKEILESGVVKDWTRIHVTDQQRVKRAMDHLLANDMKDYLDVVTLNQKPFQMRFKLEGNKSIDLSEVAKSKVNDVIEDEFYLLGQIHRNSLGGTDKSISTYLSDLNKIKTKDWEDSVDIMKKEIKNIYNSANK